MEKSIKFGTIRIPMSQVFLNRKHVYAMVNIKPVVRGHVLVCTQRQVQKFIDLYENEVLEITLTCQQVSQMLTKYYGMPVTWTIQDGQAAGQTIPHFHVHLVPRSNEPVVNLDENERKERPSEEMQQEAELYKKLLSEEKLIK